MKYQEKAEPVASKSKSKLEIKETLDNQIIGKKEDCINQESCYFIGFNQDKAICLACGMIVKT